MPPTDAELLRDYAARASERAFAEIVARHTDLVYSAALRQTGVPETARDIAQGVFTDLARKAGALAPQFDAYASLAGWLYHAARFAVLTARRDERRRQAREKTVMEQFDPAPAPDDIWAALAPVLDEAMAELGDTDREAVVLRYFQNRDFQAVAVALGVSEAAAQKRVSRAVERLRDLIAKRGVTSGTSGLVVLISANAVLVAPAGLSAALAATALAGTTILTATTAAVGKAIAMTTTQKVLVTAVLAAAVGTGIYEACEASALRTQLQGTASLAEQIQQLTRERDEALDKISGLRTGANLALLVADRSELMRLRAEVTRLQNERAGLLRGPSGDATPAATNVQLKPAFQHPFLSRLTWKNAGLTHPMQALETFLWAWSSKNETALLEASAPDTNGLPYRLTGLALDYEDRLLGAQVLEIASPNRDTGIATIIAESTAHHTDQNGRLFEGTNHGIIKLRFQKSNGEWRFAGKVY